MILKSGQETELITIEELMLFLNVQGIKYNQRSDGRIEFNNGLNFPPDMCNLLGKKVKIKAKSNYYVRNESKNYEGNCYSIRTDGYEQFHSYSWHSFLFREVYDEIMGKSYDFKISDLIILED